MAAMLNSSFGFHGPVTATLDWCESNYQFSYYIAEMANTFSNLFTIAFAIYGCFLSTREYLPSRYILGFLSNSQWLGRRFGWPGSIWFHATLLFQAQLADELPMIYVTSTTLWLLFDHKSGFNFESSRTRLLAVAMIAFDVLFTWSYYIYRNPCCSRIPLEKKRAISKLFGLGVGQFIFAFLIWNLDNLYCDALTNFKVALGWPIAFLLEGTYTACLPMLSSLSPPGHSWWHVFTVRLIVERSLRQTKILVRLVEHTTNSWELNTCESIYALKHRLL
ncbi:ceramidase-domain-containing protein [Mycena sp. CBHHK59/15]|nr:ceramidase-domain-containing protein [Mycena sp. CBHHK59/15]